MKRPPLLPIRVRKFIGMVLIISLLVFYGVLIVAFGASTWMPTNKFIEFVFYMVAGMGWAIPAGAIIWWMQRPDTQTKH